MSDTVTAPWTPEQVQNLRSYQNCDMVHPYTCGQREGHPVDPEGDHGVLVPTRDGWVCRHCDYTQKWCHGISASTDWTEHTMDNLFNRIWRL